jgi:hypothetical protein
MTSRSSRLVASAAPFFALLAACGAPPGDSSEEHSAPPATIDSHPATIEDAKITATMLEQRLAADPQDSEALAAQGPFHARLDELDHLVARIEPRAGYVVSFFETGSGAFAVEETLPKDAPSLMVGLDMSSPATVYRALTGKAAPAALTTIESQHGDATAAELTPGPALASGDDEPSSRIHAEGSNSAQFTCFSGGDFYTCQTPWAGGGSWNKNAKTSFFQIYPFGSPYSTGAALYVQMSLSSGGGFLVPVTAGTVTHLWATSPTVVHETCFLGIICNSYTDYQINNHNWVLLDAAGVTFDWSTEFRWNCDYQACNTP